MTQVRLTRVARLIARIAEVALGHHPKRADGREGPAVIAVQLVPVVTIDDDLTVKSARQFEAFGEHISRIDVSFTTVAIAVTRTIAVAKIVLFAIQSGLMTQFNPRHFNVADVLFAVTRIEVEHSVLDGACSRIRRDR